MESAKSTPISSTLRSTFTSDGWSTSDLTTNSRKSWSAYFSAILLKLFLNLPVSRFDLTVNPVLLRFCQYSRFRGNVKLWPGNYPGISQKIMDGADGFAPTESQYLIWFSF